MPARHDDSDSRDPEPREQPHYRAAPTDRLSLGRDPLRKSSAVGIEVHVRDALPGDRLVEFAIHRPHLDRRAAPVPARPAFRAVSLGRAGLYRDKPGQMTRTRLVR